LLQDQQQLNQERPKIPIRLSWIWLIKQEQLRFTNKKKIKEIVNITVASLSA